MPARSKKKSTVNEPSSTIEMYKMESYRLFGLTKRQFQLIIDEVGLKDMDEFTVKEVKEHIMEYNNRPVRRN